MRPQWLLIAAIAAAGCAPSSDVAEDDGTRASPLEPGAAVSLRTDSGHYVVAELGGGAAVQANRLEAGPWETFNIVDHDGAPLRHGDQVSVRCSDGTHFLRVEGGGGSTVDATATGMGPWERFTVERVGGGGEVWTGDRLALRTPSGHYLVAEEGGGGVLGANRPMPGPWETFTLEGRGAPVAPTVPGDGTVRPDDTRLVPPVARDQILGTVTGYEMREPCPFSDPGMCETPMYFPYDRDDPRWWDNLVEELVHSRVHVVMAHGRGCLDPTSGYDGNGNMCPRLLSRLVEAIDRAGVRDVIRLGMFDDTGAYQGTRNAVDRLPDGTRFDLADRSSWRFFWEHNMQIWFDTVPRDLWYRVDGRPVVAFWSLSSYFFAGQRGNARALLIELRRRFQERYGETPLFIVDTTWVSEDPTITPAEADGVNDWFGPPDNHYTYRSWNGTRWGAVVPAYRDPSTFPGCGGACREVGRRDGDALRTALAAGRGARFTLLEGWTNVAESAGFYRSDQWSIPNLYLDIVRDVADADTASLRFQAEAADRCGDHTGGNAGRHYRQGDLDVAELPGTGWYVGWTEPGEWIEHADVQLACGTYRFTARVATGGAARVRLEIDGASLGSISLAPTGRFELVHLGERSLPAGRRTLRLVVEEGSPDIDWFFARKSGGCG